MMSTWRWAGARSIGTSHFRSGLPCQDYAACTEFEAPAGNVLAAIVSDGAGTASHAEAGARLVCSSFLRCAKAHVAQGLALEDLDDQVIMDWMDVVRDRIGAFAASVGVTPRDCAATLVSVLAGPRSAVVIHVGDGAAVVREEGSEDWIVPSWPFHGEYASMTTFVTDDPALKLRVTRLPARLDRLAVLTDGLERLVLDHASQTAHRPFFDRFTAPVAASAVEGHDRTLTQLLRTYLDSPAVCDRTDDDKTLILATRMPADHAADPV